MGNIEYTIGAIFLLSCIILFTRALPFIFGNVIQENEWVLFLGKNLPISIIFLLAMYYGISMAKPTHWHIIPFQLIAILITLITHWRWRNTIISLVLGTLSYLTMATFF